MKNLFRTLKNGKDTGILSDNSGEGHLIAVVVVAVIVIGLAALFNSQITDFLNSMFSKFSSTASTF